MSNNLSTIQAVRQETDAVLEMLADRQISKFKIKELDFDNGIYLKDKPLRGGAMKAVLAMLNVRTGFVNYSQKMTPEDWSTVSKKIKAAEGETSMYAKLMKNEQGDLEIVDVFPENKNKKHIDDASYRQYVDWIVESLGEAETSYNLKSFNYNPQHETMDIVLLNNDRKVDVFGTDTDVWKLGERFIFNSLRFDYAPFFERLVCSNGNTATEYGFGANIAQAKFNNSKIQGIIQRNLVHGNEMIPEQLQMAVGKLRDNNVSLQEFYAYRRFFEGRNENDKYNKIIEQFFNDRPFYQAYGLNIAEKSSKWKSTANSGINAYDFFNMLTWLASHPAEVKMDQRDRLDLQIQASNLLFKREMDLQDVAAPVIVSYPKLAAMN